MEYWTKVVEWWNSTHIHEQVMEVDYLALSTNPWFMVPFVVMLLFMLFKKRWTDIILVAVCGGVWWASGTDYMSSLIVKGEIDIKKILPVVFGGAVVIGFVIYLLFGRSD